MVRRNGWVSLILLVIFALALFVVFPMDKGLLGEKGVRLGLDLQGGIHVVYQADLSSIKPGTEKEVLQGVVDVLTNRVNPLGVTEPTIYQQGNNRIVVELPGLTMTEKEKESLSRVALLEFGELIEAPLTPVITGNATDNTTGNATDNTTGNTTARWENVIGKWKPATGVIDGVEKELTSRYFNTNTYVGSGQAGGVKLVFEFDAEGSQLFQQITTRLINKQLGIFEGDTALLGEDGYPIAPVVQNVITGGGEITGLSLKEATTLSRQLNAGRLPVPLEVIREQTISPILGSDFVAKSVKGGLIGVLAVMLFMIIYYRIPGVLASLGLVFYAVINLALFKLVPVTLTLAGIAGFIVSLGMAVDANVLIFERMKEEIIAGRTVGAAIEAGFKRAWTAIWDSNVTTFVACAVLYFLGRAFSPAVQGFAVTLFIGVAVSMFTAVLVTRTLLRLFIGTEAAHHPRLFSPHMGGK
ncbi:MAG: protein translocase subunit SecD [Dehalococcoidales bacterium]|nr:protein translocase subunit SecD [Dehalococcoidales bacterium]